MNRFEFTFSLIKIPIDFVLTIVAFLFAYHLRTFTDLIPGVQLPIQLDTFPPLDTYTYFAFNSAIFLVFIFAIQGLYSLKSTKPLISESISIIIACVYSFLGVVFYFFLIREFPFSRLAIIYSFIFNTVFIITSRVCLHIFQNFLLKIGFGQKTTIIVGANKSYQKLVRAMKKEANFKVIGYLENKKNPKLNNKYLGKIEDFQAILKEYKPHQIIFLKSNTKESLKIKILKYCKYYHIEYIYIPDVLDLHQSRIETIYQNGIPLISLKPTPLDGWGYILKRLFDILASFFGLIIISPILITISLLIKITSKGPILFYRLPSGKRVKRVGQYGKLFPFLKFRTMKDNSHNLRYTELSKKNHRSGPLVKIKNDPRVTYIGNFLRKTDLDELPQLWNVLKGEMSLVGPRPHLPEEVEKYQEYQLFVLNIKPGITGMAQVSGRSNISFQEEVKLDTFYIENWSLILDLKILLKTFYIVSKRILFEKIND